MTMASLRLLRSRALPAMFDWRRNMRPILLIAVPALVIIAALTFWLQGGRYASTENAYVKADIAQIASEVQGRIAALTIRDHATVAQGEVLVRLDPEPYRLALAKAEAELDSARSAIEQLKVSLRESKAEHKEAQSRMLYLEVQAKRQHDLAERGVSPATKIELADSEALQARDRVSMLRERIARVEAALGGNPERPTDSYAAVREKMALRDAVKSPAGARLFAEPRLSITGQYSCRSCHAPERAFTDGRERSLGATGAELPLNAPTLLNAAYNASLGWNDECTCPASSSSPSASFSSSSCSPRGKRCRGTPWSTRCCCRRSAMCCARWSKFSGGRRCMRRSW